MVVELLSHVMSGCPKLEPLTVFNCIRLSLIGSIAFDSI